MLSEMTEEDLRAALIEARNRMNTAAVEHKAIAKEIASRRAKGVGIEAKRFKAKQWNNTSGARGVTFNKNAGKWQAKIGVDGRVRHLGYFQTEQEAEQKRTAAEVEFWGKSTTK